MLFQPNSTTSQAQGRRKSSTSHLQETVTSNESKRKSSTASLKMDEILNSIETKRKSSLSQMPEVNEGSIANIEDEMANLMQINGLQSKISYRKAIAASGGTYSGSGSYPGSTMDIGFCSSQTCIKYYADWTESSTNGEHIWVDTNASGDFCYISEDDCCKTGPKKKCCGCKIMVHVGCLAHIQKINFRCKPTYREAGVRTYRSSGTNEMQVRHHWVHRMRQDGKCKTCSKTFQQKFPFNYKEVISISCSWCKHAYHNKTQCFKISLLQEECSLGSLASIIVPPSWIIKIPKKNNFKSSVRRRGARNSLKRPRKSGGTSRSQALSSNLFSNSATVSCPFVIKPVPAPHLHPVIVFVNPKSGGNQGARLLHKFYWLLNPRQVFDLSLTQPSLALELYHKVPNLRILVCGGDGTVGWILSIIDSLGISPFPPVAVLPLGTGNDLARTIMWGSCYTDEPLQKVLAAVQESRIIQLDRWDLSLHHPSEDVILIDEDIQDKEAMRSLPLNVFNNYFSIGADASAALEFHESREAKPAKFNSRLRNKIFYAGVGGKDLLRRSWRDLCDYVTLLCDEKDMTPMIRQYRFHCLLFLNITKYSAGTMPWGNPTSGFEPQKMDDGYLEVIGFTSTSLATLQMGGHGERVCQCQKVTLTTTKVLPMQVDGEPCRIEPCSIKISYRNQARLLQKPKHRASVSLLNEESSDYGFSSQGYLPERLRIQVSVISITDYEEMVFDKEILKQKSVPLGIIAIDTDAGLDLVRKYVDVIAETNNLMVETEERKLSNSWVFLDSTTSNRFFRIDRKTEALHYVTDISSEDLYILDPEFRKLSIPAHFFIHTSASMDQISKTLVDEENTQNLKSYLSGPNLSDSQFLLDMDKKLIKRRESIKDAQNKNFLESCKRGQMSRVEELWRAGVDLLHLDSSGMSCLHHASRFGRKEIVRFLLEVAPKELIDMRDVEKGQTALHKASWYQRRLICCLLISAGASLTIRDNTGLTPSQQALKADDRELSAYLDSQAHLAKIKTFEHETVV